MNAIGWFDIYVNDLNRAVKFYEAALNCKLEPIGDPTGENQMMSFPADMNAYGAGGALTKSPHVSPGIGGTIIYFNSEDCAVEESRVSCLGGRVVKSKFSIGEFGWVSVCLDTEGNLFGISSLK